MFGLFQSKEKKQIKRLKEIAEEIEAAGGCQFVCDGYLEFFLANDLKSKVGLVPEAESPFSRSMVMEAALILLDIFKVAKVGISPALINAQSAYVNCAFMATSEELEPILALLEEGKPVEKLMLSQYYNLNEKYKKVWVEFTESETPVLIDLFREKKSK